MIPRLSISGFKFTAKSALVFDEYLRMKINNNVKYWPMISLWLDRVCDSLASKAMALETDDKILTIK